MDVEDVIRCDLSETVLCHRRLAGPSVDCEVCR